MLEQAVQVRDRPATDDAWAKVYVRSYLLLRLGIGALGLALPIVLVVVVDLLEGTNPATRGSFSAYYYTGARDVFVGTLCVIGVFLIGYKFQAITPTSLEPVPAAQVPVRESRVTTVAGLAAVLVAFFPTGRPDDSVPQTALQDFLGESVVTGIHYGAAVLFILALAFTSFHFAVAEGPRSHRPRAEQELQRWTPVAWQRFHAACGIVILLAVAGGALFTFTPLPDRYALFVVELVATWAFAVSWLAKGAEWKALGWSRAERRRAAQPDS